MAKFLAVAFAVLLGVGGVLGYQKLSDSTTEQRKLGKRLDDLSQWGEGVSAWARQTDAQFAAQLKFQTETRDWMKQNQESIVQQLNQIQTVLDGQAAKAAADVHASPEEKKEAIEKKIEDEASARRGPIEDQLESLEQDLPDPASPDYQQQKDNLDQHRATHQQLQDMAANPAETFADGKQAEEKAKQINEQINDQKERVQGEIKSLEEERAQLLQEQQDILKHDPLTDQDKARLEEIRKRLQEIEEKLKEKEKEFDLLKMFACFLKVAIYVGSFYADYNAPGSGQGLRELADQIPCELGGGGKGNGEEEESDGDGPGGGHPPTPPGPPPGPPPGVPSTPPTTAPAPTPGSKSTGGGDSTGNVRGTSKDGLYHMNLSGNQFQFREKGQAEWTNYITLTPKGVEAVKSGTVVDFDPNATNNNQSFVLVEDPNKNQFIVFENEDPKPYKAFGGADKQ